MAKRLIAILLAVICVAVSVPVVFAAAPSVEMHNGQRTAFLSTFGKLPYGGQTRVTFRKFADAYNALGMQGGRIVVSGKFDMAGFNDAAGRNLIVIEGSGKKATEAELKFPAGTMSIDFRGDTYLDNLILRTEEGVPIYSNGYKLTFSPTVDSYFYEQHVSGGQNTFNYLAPFIVGTGSTWGKKADTITLSGGHFKAVAGGSLGESANSITDIVINGGDYASVYGGNLAGSFTGEANVAVSGGNIDNLYVGSADGTFNGNIFVTVSGGKIGTVSMGSVSGGAKVNGNVVLRLNSDSASSYNLNKNGSVSGKTVLITDHVIVLRTLEQGQYDYLIHEDGAKVTPVFNGTTLAGFKVQDKNGFIPKKTYANGSEIYHNNGIFNLPAGKVTVTCEENSAVVVNKNASYVAGYEDGTFRPQNNMTRAEAITLLSRIITPDIKLLPSVVSCEYADVASTDWYAGVIGFFQKLGYLEKLESEAGTKINPNKQITRAEFAELSAKVLSLIYDGRSFGIKSFADVPSSNIYFSAIGQLGYLGVIGGYEDGSFRPENNITRAEVATIVNRFLGRTPTGNAGSASFSDVAGHWALSQIVTACNPATVGGATVWTVTDDITKGNYTLLDGATVSEQIKKFYELYSSGQIVGKDATQGIDMISKWQIDNIVNAPSNYSAKGKTYYISNNGNDANNGTSASTPWATLTKLKTAELNAGDVVLLERGSTFRGTIGTVSGVTYSAYGVGDKPIISGSARNYADPSLWIETRTPNLYRLNGSVKNVGSIIFNDSAELGNYNELVGVQSVVGRDGFTGIRDMKTDLEFFSNLQTQELYLYSTQGNPATRFQSIEIATQSNLVDGVDIENVVIDNIRARHTGGHAFTFGGHIKNVTVRNCIADYVGGSILQGHAGGNITGYGNAYQLYGGCDGWYVYDCWAYQIYDTGVTHQYTPYDKLQDCHMNDVRYTGNVLELCEWSIEHYNIEHAQTKTTHNNVYVSGNICRLNGYGFGSRTEYREGIANLVQSCGVTKNCENFVMENNIFDRSAAGIFDLLPGGDKKLVLRNNVYVQKVGGKLGTFFGQDILATEDWKTNLFENVNDTTSVVLYNDDTLVSNYTPARR